jgi:hypothetical protein
MPEFVLISSIAMISRWGRILAKPIQKEMKDVDLNSYPYPFKEVVSTNVRNFGAILNLFS